MVQPVKTRPHTRTVNKETLVNMKKTRFKLKKRISEMDAEQEKVRLFSDFQFNLHQWFSLEQQEQRVQEKPGEDKSNQ